MDLLSLRKNVLGLICLVITAVIFLAGLWPFNFSPENKVRWLADQNGVEFYGPALVFSTIPSSVFTVSTRNTQLATRNSHHTSATPFFQSSNIPVKSCSIELFLQPTSEDISHIGHIFSILNEQGSETFFVGQWRSHLLLRKGIHDKKNYREIGVRDALKKGDKRFVTITSGADGTNIYIDGILMKSSPRFQLFSMNEKPSGRILLGNSPKGGGYWTGNLFGLAIYNRSLSEEQVLKSFENWEKNKKSLFQKEEGLVLSYLFNEHSGTLAHDSVGGHNLVIPSKFEVLKKTTLVPPWEDFPFTRSYLMDILTNILGFIPFGFFFSAYLRMKKPRSNFRLLLLSVIIAGCMSLLIELTQVYLPARSSQLTDVISNMVGTALGVVLFYFYPHNKKYNSTNLPIFHSSTLP